MARRTVPADMTRPHQEQHMKHLAYATIANDHSNVQVSTWQEDHLTVGTDAARPLEQATEWRYKFTVNGRVLDEGTLGPVEE